MWRDASNKDQRSAYMAEYYRKNRGKFTRSPEQQRAYNALRRKQYSESLIIREETKARATAWRNQNRGRYREAVLLRKYGLTMEAYNKLLRKQRGRCAICGFADQSNPQAFPVVDHCHKTGKVRGLLCRDCNRGLGFLKDQLSYVRKAAVYLSK